MLLVTLPSPPGLAAVAGTAGVGSVVVVTSHLFVSPIWVPVPQSNPVCVLSYETTHLSASPISGSTVVPSAA